MSIEDEENKLFEEWQRNTPGFVKDGAVDEAAYLTSVPRILFVLKEVNDSNGGNWDLREFVRKGGRPHTWDNTTRWIKGIRHLPEDFAWRTIAKVSEEERRHELQSIAALNLKKSPGGHTTVYSDLKRAAAKDRQYLQQQFAIYKPDIVICCGTAREFQAIAPPCAGGEWSMTARGVEFYQYEPGKFVIKYMHPEARATTSVHYYGLIDTVRELLFPRK